MSVDDRGGRMILMRIDVHHLVIAAVALERYIEDLKANPANGLDAIEDVEEALDWIRNRGGR